MPQPRYNGFLHDSSRDPGSIAAGLPDAPSLGIYTTSPFATWRCLSQTHSQLYTLSMVHVYLSNVYFYDIGLGGNFREKVQIFSRFYLRCSKITFISVQPDLKMCLTCLLIHLLCSDYIHVYQRRWALSFAYVTIPDFFCQVSHTCLSQDKVFPWNELNITTCHKDSVNKKMS